MVPDVSPIGLNNMTNVVLIQVPSMRIPCYKLFCTNNIIDAKTFFKIGPEIYPLYGQLVHFAAFKHKSHD